MVPWVSVGAVGVRGTRGCRAAGLQLEFGPADSTCLGLSQLWCCTQYTPSTSRTHATQESRNFSVFFFFYTEKLHFHEIGSVVIL